MTILPESMREENLSVDEILKALDEMEELLKEKGVVFKETPVEEFKKWEKEI